MTTQDGAIDDANRDPQLAEALRMIELAAFANIEVERRDHLALAAPTQSLNVCFRYLPEARPDAP